MDSQQFDSQEGQAACEAARAAAETPTEAMECEVASEAACGEADGEAAACAERSTPTGSAEQAAAAGAAMERAMPASSNAEQPAAADAARHGEVEWRRRFIIKVPLHGSLAARLVAGEKLQEARVALLKAQPVNVALMKRIDVLEVAERRARGDGDAARRVPELLRQIDELDRHNKELAYLKRYTETLDIGKAEIADAKLNVAKAQKESAKAAAAQQEAEGARDYARGRVDKMRETAKDEEKRREEAEKKVRVAEAAAAESAKLAARKQPRIEELEAELRSASGTETALRQQLRDLAEAGRVESDVRKAELELEKERVCAAEKCASEAVSALRQATARKPGREPGHRGRAELEDRWPEMTRTAQYRAMLRHTHDIADILEEVAADWEPTAFATALQWLDLLPDLLATRPFAVARLDFVSELTGLLQAEWNVSLALYLKTELGISDNDYQRLRLAMCKVYSDGRWQRRLWYEDEVTGIKLWLPQPLVARWQWLSAWRDYNRRYGLTYRADGTVAQRDYLELLTQMVERDLALLCIAVRNSRELPWHPAFHIDATSISARRAFTHAGITLGGMYQNKKHVQSELKLMTLAVGTVKDNAPGQRLILGDGFSSGIAAEIAELHINGVLGAEIYEEGALDGQCEYILAGHCCPVACLDLAAARALRACRGKAACLCGCQTTARLQSYPGNDGIAAIPDGDNLPTWRAAEEILRGACSYGTDKMTYASLEAAAHVPPRGYNFEVSGAWRCSHCGEAVWASLKAYEEAKAELAALAARAADEDDDAQKELTKLLKAHAVTHMEPSISKPPSYV